MPRRPGTNRQRPCGILLAVGEPNSLGDARCHRRCGAPPRSEAAPASPALDRRVPEYHSRSPCARLVRGLSPGEHNFDLHSAGIHTAGPLGILPNTQRSARDLSLATITHTRLRYEVAPRIVSRRRGVEARWRRTGRGREGRTCIAYTRYVSPPPPPPPPHGPTKRNAIHVLRGGDREPTWRLRGYHSELASSRPGGERGRVVRFEDDDRQDSPRARSRGRQSCATPPTTCRRCRSAIVPRIGVAAYRLSSACARARAHNRSIADKLRFTYARYAHAAWTDVDVELSCRCGGLLHTRARSRARTHAP